MKFTSQNKQLTFDLFRSSLEELDKTNRWVMLGDLLPWAEIEKRYNSKLNNQVKGAGNKPARLIIGAMIIKHKLNLGYISDNCLQRLSYEIALNRRAMASRILLHALEIARVYDMNRVLSVRES